VHLDICVKPVLQANALDLLDLIIANSGRVRKFIQVSSTLSLMEVYKSIDDMTRSNETLFVKNQVVGQFRATLELGSTSAKFHIVNKAYWLGSEICGHGVTYKC